MQFRSDLIRTPTPNYTFLSYFLSFRLPLLVYPIMDLGYKRLRFDVSEYIGVGVSYLIQLNRSMTHCLKPGDLHSSLRIKCHQRSTRQPTSRLTLLRVAEIFYKNAKPTSWSSNPTSSNRS